MTANIPNFMPEPPSIKAINALYIDYLESKSLTRCHQRKIKYLRFWAVCMAIFTIIFASIGTAFVKEPYSFILLFISPVLAIAALLWALSKLLSAPPAYCLYSLSNITPHDFNILNITPEIEKDMNMIFKNNLCAKRYIKQLVRQKRSLYVFEYRLLIDNFFRHYVSRYRPD